jgi:hypothetical protein
VRLRHGLLFLMYKMPSGISRRALFMCHHRRLPHLRHPSTFNEKMNWRILYDRRPILEWTCDKLAMKEYAVKNSSVRAPRTYWSGTDLRELSDVKLPGSWVLKPNNRSGKVFFGRGEPDIAYLRRLTANWLRPSEGKDLHEWAYLNARPLLLVEEQLGEPGIAPLDYKFYTFDGEVAIVQVDMDRHTEPSRRLYRPDWTPLDATWGHCRLGPPQQPPANLAEMLAIAGDLGRSFDFLRVDLYNVSGVIYFGEITPYAGSGLNPLIPKSLDAHLGAKWSLLTS